MRKFTNESVSSMVVRKNSTRVDADASFWWVVHSAGVVSLLLSISIITNAFLAMLDPLPRTLPIEKDPRRNSKHEKYGMHYASPIPLVDETYVFSHERFNTCCFKYYMERPDGSRSKNSIREAEIYVEDNKTQRAMLHGFHVFLALPGLFMPFLLCYAYYYKTHTLYVWWICWITLFNVHSLVEIFIIAIKIIHAVFLRDPNFLEIKPLPTHSMSYVMFRTLFNLVKKAAFPITFYLSLLVLKHYRQLSELHYRQEMLLFNENNNNNEARTRASLSSSFSNHVPKITFDISEPPVDNGDDDDHDRVAMFVLFGWLSRRRSVKRKASSKKKMSVVCQT